MPRGILLLSIAIPNAWLLSFAAVVLVRQLSSTRIYEKPSHAAGLARYTHGGTLARTSYGNHIRHVLDED